MSTSGSDCSSTDAYCDDDCEMPEERVGDPAPQTGGTAGVAADAPSTHEGHSARVQRAKSATTTSAGASSSEAVTVDGEYVFERLASQLPAERVQRVLGRSRAGVPFRGAYTVGDVIGTGSSSVVCACQDRRTSETFAAKLVRVVAGASCPDNEVRSLPPSPLRPSR